MGREANSRWTRGVLARVSLAKVVWVALAFVLGGLACSRLGEREPIGSEQQALPTNWANAALGTPDGGSTTHDPDSGTFTLTSTGQGVAYTEVDLVDEADGMQFSYIHLSDIAGVEDDVEIVARVA